MLPIGRVEEITAVEQNPQESATYLWVAETVLRQQGRPLKARQIVSFGIDNGLFADKDLSRTPEKSMQARLSIDILSKGVKSRFLRTGRGRFYLRELYGTQQDNLNHGIQEYTAIRRAPADPSENVLVIPASRHRSVLDFQGILSPGDELLSRLVADKSLDYLVRTEAEVNSDFKQFVTYTIIQNKNQILSFRRGRYNRAASFLRGARCIGFGGHVTEEDYNILTYSDRGVRANAAREISEEIRLQSGPPSINPDDIEILGVLNDDSSDVGVRHVGIVMRYWAPDIEEWKRPMRGEASVTQLRWIKTHGSEIDLLEFEYWSQLCLRKFFPSFLTSGPAYRIIKPNAFEGVHLLCVLGSVGSGKSVTTRLLCETAGYQQVNTGKVVARLLGIPPVPETPRQEFQEKSQAFISQTGAPERLAREILREVDAIASSRIIIDGVRQLETLEKLKDLSSRRVSSLFVYTPPDIAYELYVVRESRENKISASDFMKIFNAPVESQVRMMIQDADAVIYNWFGLESYNLTVSHLMDNLAIGGSIKR